MTYVQILSRLLDESEMTGWMITQPLTISTTGSKEQNQFLPICPSHYALRPVKKS